MAHGQHADNHDRRRNAKHEGDAFVQESVPLHDDIVHVDVHAKRADHAARSGHKRPAGRAQPVPVHVVSCGRNRSIVVIAGEFFQPLFCGTDIKQVLVRVGDIIGHMIPLKLNIKRFHMIDFLHDPENRVDGVVIQIQGRLFLFRRHGPEDIPRHIDLLEIIRSLIQVLVFPGHPSRTGNRVANIGIERHHGRFAVHPVGNDLGVVRFDCLFPDIAELLRVDHLPEIVGKYRQRFQLLGTQCIFHPFIVDTVHTLAVDLEAKEQQDNRKQQDHCEDHGIQFCRQRKTPLFLHCFSSSRRNCVSL